MSISEMRLEVFREIIRNVGTDNAKRLIADPKAFAGLKRRVNDMGNLIFYGSDTRIEKILSSLDSDNPTIMQTIDSLLVQIELSK